MDSCQRYKVAGFCGILDDESLDGVLMINVLNNDESVEIRAILVRMLYTDSGHYLIPTDRFDITDNDDEQDYLRQCVKAYLDASLDPKGGKRFLSRRKVSFGATTHIEPSAIDTSETSVRLEIDNTNGFTQRPVTLITTHDDEDLSTGGRFGPCPYRPSSP